MMTISEAEFLRSNFRGQSVFQETSSILNHSNLF